jgi:hypothetical protein
MCARAVLIVGCTLRYFDEPAAKCAVDNSLYLAIEQAIRLAQIPDAIAIVGVRLAEVCAGLAAARARHTGRFADLRRAGPAQKENRLLTVLAVSIALALGCQAEATTQVTVVDAAVVLALSGYQ